MTPTLKFPFYARLALILTGLIAIAFIARVGKDVFIPLMLAMLFAILLRPIVSFLTRRLRFPNVIASIVAVLIFVIIVGGIIWFVSWQITDFASDWSNIKRNFAIHFYNIKKYIHESFGVSMAEQQQYIDDMTKNGMKDSGAMIGSTLMSFTDVLFTAALIPIYTFLMLLYRTHFMKFLCKLVDKQHHKTLEDIMGQIKYAVKNYLVGLTTEMVVVSVLTAIGLWLFGVPYALLLGALTGLLNLIPYIGLLVAYAVSILATLTGTTDISLILGVIITNAVVQFLDNNILVPMIVSSKVQVNALVSIVGIVAGGMLWGVPGMFLAIPMIAIMKVIFDRVKDLEPWGYLLGDDIPKTYQWHRIRLPRYSYDSGDDTPPAPPAFTSTATIPLENDTETKDKTDTNGSNP